MQKRLPVTVAALVGFIGLSVAVTPTSWWENGGRLYFAAVYGLVVILPLLLYVCWKVREGGLPIVEGNGVSGVAEFPRIVTIPFEIADTDQSGLEPGEVRMVNWEAEVLEVSPGRYMSPLWPDDQKPKSRSEILKELRRGLRKFWQKREGSLVEATATLLREEELREIGQRVVADPKAVSIEANAACEAAEKV
ncbi:MAG: hypothetical protein WCW25_02625 [Patescibacteria group bacterium]|jgi:hypothetical protein